MLLGAPLSTRDALSETQTARKAELRRMLYRLADVATHDALMLLRYSVIATRLLHTLRCCPCADHPELTKYDAELRSGLSIILNLPITDEAWIQASLPVNRGGFGIRSVTSLALPPSWHQPQAPIRSKPSCWETQPQQKTKYVISLKLDGVLPARLKVL